MLHGQHSQGWEIIANVYNFIKEEADKKQFTIPLSKDRERTAAVVGVSETLVRKVKNDFKKLKEDKDYERNEEICDARKTRTKWLW